MKLKHRKRALMLSVFINQLEAGYSIIQLLMILAIAP